MNNPVMNEIVDIAKEILSSVRSYAAWNSIAILRDEPDDDLAGLNQSELLLVLALAAEIRRLRQADDHEMLVRDMSKLRERVRALELWDK